MKIPAEVGGDDPVGEDTGRSKTNVVIALFNESLDVAAEKLRGVKPVKRETVPSYRQWTERDATSPSGEEGLCASHYQAARRPQPVA